MRNYKAKIAKYRLPKQRYTYLREYCLNSDRGERLVIETAILNAFGDDQIGKFIYRHVVSTDFNWPALEANHIPCSRDTFRIYRAKFFYELDQLLKRGGF